MGCLVATKIILRVVELIFALIAFACAAWLLDIGWTGSELGFMVFTGVTGFLLAAFYLVVAKVQSLQKMFSGLTEIIINSVWAIFWLAAAGAFASRSGCKPSSWASGSKECNTYLTSCAFGFMSWLLWMFHIIPAVMEMRNGAGPRAARGYSSGGPQSSAAVV